MCYICVHVGNVFPLQCTNNSPPRQAITFPLSDPKDLSAILLVTDSVANRSMDVYLDLLPSKKKGLHPKPIYLWHRKIGAALRCIGMSVMTGTDRFNSVSAPDTSIILATGWDNSISNLVVISISL